MNDDKEFLNRQRRQERFSLIFCNAALILVLFLPGQDIPLNARIGFLMGLALLDAVMILIRIRFGKDSSAAKQNRTFRTLYYVSWGMVGLAFLLLLGRRIGFFKSGPEFSLYSVGWTAEAESLLENKKAAAEGEVMISGLIPVSSSAEISSLAEELELDEETVSRLTGDFTEDVFKAYSVEYAVLTTGQNAGQIAADSEIQETGGGTQMTVTVFFKPSGSLSEKTNAYLLFVKTPAKDAEGISSAGVELREI